ncbi:MAG: hypothetical protein ACYS0C_03075 [Planctomycetota bacterium]
MRQQKNGFLDVILCVVQRRWLVLRLYPGTCRGRRTAHCNGLIWCEGWTL